MDIIQLSPGDLSELLESDHSVFLLDVREEEEFDFCKIIGSVNIPLINLVQNLQKIDQDKLVVTICHHGHRSLKAAMTLKDLGFCDVRNLKGGIDAWSTNIDPEVKRY